MRAYSWLVVFSFAGLSACNNPLAPGENNSILSSNHRPGVGGGIADHLVLIQGNNQTASVGTTLVTNPQVQVQDILNQPISGVDLSFQIAQAGVPTAGSVGSSLVTTDAFGLASTSWTLGSVPGSYTLWVTPVLSLGGFPSSLSLSSTAVAGAVVSAPQLSLSTLASPGVAGASFSLTVTVKDGLGNTNTAYTGTVTLSSSDGAATLPLAHTFTGGDAGVYTFTSLALKTIGIQTVTASDGTLSKTSNSVTVNPGVATQLSVSTLSSPKTSGTVFTLVVTALDAFGNTATSYTGTVTLTSSDPLAVLPAAHTYVAGDAGTFTFTSIALNTGGSRTITAGDGTLTKTSNSVSVNPGAATQLVFSSIPSPKVAGASFGLSITVKDAAGNTVTGYTGTVTLTSSDGAASIPAAHTYVAGDAGVFTFTPVSFTTPGVQTMSAGDGTLTATSNNVTVNVGAVSQFTLSTLASPQNAGGSSFSLTVTARDSVGNVVTSYVGTVTLTSSDGAASIPAAHAYVAGDAGVFTFTPISFTTPGVQTMSAGDGTRTATSNNVTVNVGAVSQLTLSTIASPQSAGGSSFSLTVTARDSVGNVVTSYVGTVSLTSSDGAATLPAAHTFTVGNAGVFTFTGIVFKTTGSQTITAGDGTRTKTSNTVTVNPGVATHIVTSTISSSQTAGVSFNVTVSARDSLNNNATSYLGTVTLTTGDSAAVLPASHTYVAGDAGTYTFTGTTLKTAGTYTITATAGPFSSISNTFTVNAGAFSLAQSTVGAAFTKVLSGSPVTVTLTAKDAYGNLNPSGVTTVTFTTSPAATGTFGTQTSNGSQVYKVPYSVSTLGTVTLGATLNGSTVASTVALQVIAHGFPIGIYSWNLNFNFDVKVDSLGNIYVLDSGNNRVIKYGPAGNYLYTIMGYFDFSYLGPAGIASDSVNHLYVADNSGRVLEFDANGNYLYQMLDPGAPSLGSPTAVAIAPSTQSVYFVDAAIEGVQTYSQSGSYPTPLTKNATYLTSWTATSGGGSLSNPVSITVDASGNVYVAEISFSIIYKYTSTGTYITEWDGSDSGTAFNSPGGVTADASGNIYIADSGNNRIVKTSSTGTYLSQFGSFGAGNGLFNGPQGVGIDPLGNILVADSGNNQVQEFDSNGNFLRQTNTTSAGSAYGQFNSPDSTALDSAGNIYVADTSNNRIQKFNSTGSYVTQWGSSGTGNGQFSSPQGIGVDSSSNVYVSDTGNNRVQKFTSSGTYTTQWGSAGATNGLFNSPRKLATDSSSNVYVVDTGNNRVQKFTSSGTYTTQWGSSGSGSGQFNFPASIAVDTSNNIYVVDKGNSRVQKFNSSGSYLSQWGSNGNGNGLFNNPNGIAIDASNTIYVSSNGNNLVQKFNSSGTFVLQWGSSGADTGQFNVMSDVAVDSSGNVYVLDSGSSLLQKFDSSGNILLN